MRSEVSITQVDSIGVFIKHKEVILLWRSPTNPDQIKYLATFFLDNRHEINFGIKTLGPNNVVVKF